MAIQRDYLRIGMNLFLLIPSIVFSTILFAQAVAPNSALALALVSDMRMFLVLLLTIIGNSILAIFLCLSVFASFFPRLRTLRLVMRYQSICAYLQPAMLIASCLLTFFVTCIFISSVVGNLYAQYFYVAPQGVDATDPNAAFYTTVPYATLAAALVVVVACYYFALSRKALKYSVLVRLPGTIYIFICASCALFVMTMLVVTSRPQYYVDMDLDDVRGRYLVNYDGDYWLTYYTDTNNCYGQPERSCLPNWVKKGNAPISATPTDLDSMLDNVPVKVDGHFVPHCNLFNIGTTCIDPTAPKMFCLQGGCRETHGPGIWYMSPLVIESITVVQ